MDIIISDTHIARDFDSKKYSFLHDLFSKANRIIINGDFLDMYFCAIDDIKKSKWMGLLDIIKKKNAVIVLGNHDSLIRKFYSQYSKTVLDQYDCRLAGKKFTIIHGHQIVPNLSEKYQFLKRFPLIYTLGKYRNKFSWMIFKMKGQMRYQKLNEKMKLWKALHLKKAEYLITSHTHYPEYDKNARFLNTGFIDYGFASYIKIDNNEISLVQITYG